MAVTSLKDGSSFNYVTLGVPAGLQFGATTDFSVAFWTRFTNWTGDPVLIGNKDWRSGGNQGWVVATAGNGRLQWNLGDGDAGGRTRVDYDGPAGTLSDGIWHHIVAVFDRKNGSVTYLDGNAVSTNAITADLGLVDAPPGLALNIGQDGMGSYTDNGAVGILDGFIDEVGLWTRPLTPADVKLLHSRGVAGLGIDGHLPVVVADLPRLAVERTPAGVRIVWPTGQSGVELQSAPALGDAPVWQTVPSRVEGPVNVAELAVDATRFFRLRRP